MSITQPPIPMRETPAAITPQPTPAFPDASTEPALAMDDIQGNIIPGFHKDFETLLFLRISNPGQCKEWIRHITPCIATAEEVLSFNRLFKKIRYRRGYEAGTVKATWVNIAFSFQGLKKLRPDADQFTDQAFKAGLAARSPDLGDPTGENDEGNPKNWVIGGRGNEADILLIVQSDDYEDLQHEVQHIKQSIYNLRSGNTRVPSGVTLLYEEHGANPTGRLSSHEHFGFLDGVSQPGIRGRVSEDPHDVLTPRQNPRDPDQGKPGQDLLWPGEFVFDYQYQDPKKEVSEPSDDKTETRFHKGKLSEAGPTWAKHGSFLVFRRLRQDVGAFHSFLKEQAEKLQVDPAFLGAKIVGRWPSGAPILRSVEADNPNLGGNDCANNDFEFFKKDPSLIDDQPDKQPPPDILPPVGTDNQCTGSGKFPASHGDRLGQICPFAGHIRKAYPRDDITPAGRSDPSKTDEQKSDLSEQDTQTHRLLRRGLPYGPVSMSTFEKPIHDHVDRGLLFVCYQTSIEGQFEFVTRNWVNNPAFSQPNPPEAGFDLVIGQNGQGNRQRTATISLNPVQDKTIQLQANQEWVIPTGGGYFFSPSLSALEGELVS